MRHSRLMAVAAAIPIGCLLISCGGGSNSISASMPPAPSNYTATILVGNNGAITALHTDSNLINPWGLAFNPTTYAWISDAGSPASTGNSVSTLYDGNGVVRTAPGASSPVITIPANALNVASPTGIVYNQDSSGFMISGTPAQFLYATLGGEIEGWAQSVNPNSAVLAYDDSGAGAQYTGLTMVKDSSGNYFLYAADFHNCQVDVYTSGSWGPPATGEFSDPSPPSGFTGYCPYGIQSIPSGSGGAQIYVTYAHPSTSAQRVVIGAGDGYVAVFDADGTFVANLVSGGALNAPWGIALAPSNFGPLSGDLLIGNFGDGAINAFNASTGASMGAVMNSSGFKLIFPDLWALQFGNGTTTEPSNTLFFTSGPATQTYGVYGRIDVAGTYTPP